MSVERMAIRQDLRPNRPMAEARCIDVDVASREPKGTPFALGAASWQVLHTRARQEKALARTLEAAGIDHYLPLTPRSSIRGGRKRIVQEPLFASYLFMYGATEAGYFAVATKRVSNVIRVTDQGRFVQELQQIRIALENRAELSPSRYLEVGRRVRVVDGPFRGIEGLIEDRSKIDRLVLQIAALGRATSLEIDADLLEPVE